MTIQYTVSFENGKLKIIQDVDTDGSSNGLAAHAKSNAAGLKILGDTIDASKAALGPGGNAADPLGPGGNAADPLGPGGNAADPLGPGGGTSGQIIVLGPVIIDTTGLIHKRPASESAEKAKEEN